ncbi:hypothetical protein [Flavimarina sp. Hel_I_48]|uniref:hypothetical protein n=1 Tax=Flavimarina sp. Hel_I_48 TaxID=1392488 RepID=UPI000B1E162F|nr:hypothetical protein [Flavimarina sp. Hel_I_48]
MKIQKIFVLSILFILPVVAYLFFASGVHNFAKLPTVSEGVEELSFSQDIKLKDKITVLGFLGTDLKKDGPVLFNLNQKIYKYFYEFNDFQFVYLVPKSVSQQELQNIITELERVSNLKNWHFVYAEDEQIKAIFSSLNSAHRWSDNDGSPYVFIVDKDRNLRGRDDDEDVGTLYGYNSTDVAELADKMKDDVKIVLAEYRLALKKNNAVR